ncbi:MAG: hypothetical protein L0Z52_01605 [Acidobacteria bacterium]|nr:hypothetical protein [Acidobacteriota bacterium]
MALDIGGLAFRLIGSDGPLRESLDERYAAFLGGSEVGAFRIRLLDAGKDHFVAPDQVSRDNPHPLSMAWEANVLLVQSFGFAGWIDVKERRGELALGRDEFEKATWCVENYLRVCTAWRVVEEGGALLHAASLAHEGKGYLFLGASGSGKSTLAASSRCGEVISDDLTLVRRRDGAFRVAATPFRGTYLGGRPIRGDFPIGGMYRIFKASRNRVEPCPRNHAVADLLAAAPFVVDQLNHDPRILSHLKALDASHPLSYLHFNLEGDFWNVLALER